MRKLTLVIAGIAALTLALTGCASGGGEPAPEIDLDPSSLGSVEVQEAMAEMYEKAVENNESTVITYGPNEVIFASAYEKFSQRYPKVRVQGEFIYGAELTTRLDQEFASGKHVGSILTGGPALALASTEADRCEVWAPVDGTKMQYPMRDSIIGDGAATAVIGFPAGIVYNSDNFSDDAPKSWLELADPVWKDQIVLNDVRQVNGASQTMAQLLAGGHVDEEWLQGLKANNPQLNANTGINLQAVNSGQAAMDGLGFYVYYLEAIQNGEPLKFVFPTEDFSYMQYHYSCKFVDGPNPNATDLLMNWLFTPEGQAAVAENGVYALHEEAPAPYGLPALADIKDGLIDPAPIEDTNEITKTTIATMKDLFQ